MNSLQKHWDARAALNFILGGMGAGLMIAAALAHAAGRAPILLSLVLVAAGLGAVWLEIGKKFRALNVFINPFTSWMTRESFIAALLISFGAAAMVKPQPFLPLAAATALVFVWCQGRILHASKGIPAWRAPQVVQFIVSTGLAEGAGLALFFSTEPLLLTWFALALVLRAVAWTRYAAAAPSAALESPGKALLQIGTVAALALALAGAWFPAAAPLAGAAALATGLWLKFALVTRAAFNQGYALPRLPVRGTR
ncbi:MAG: phenylacetyl-CoA:acceptor oxidoreductase [Betaproteobacteria bacterium]|nr:phenylacetyl-CoA:acceptor oxidoreductase [Betaproteobacteria bacterium]